MIKKVELKVIERVTITLEVVEADGDSCKGCFFNHRKSCGEWRQYYSCSTKERLDNKNVIFKRIKKQKRKMKENKHSLKISRSCGDTTLDGYPIATYSNDELKILKRLLTKVLGEVNEYLKE